MRIAILLAALLHAATVLGISLLPERRVLSSRLAGWKIGEPADVSLEDAEVERRVEPPASPRSRTNGEPAAAARETPKRLAARAPRVRGAAEPPAAHGGDASPEHGSTGETNDAWSEPGDVQEPGLHLPLRLTWDRLLEERGPAAPSETPRARRASRDAADLALIPALRAHNAKLGLGNPEENAVATAVQTAGRALTVPKDTRFRIEVELDREGNVLGARVLSASAGDEGTWSGLVEAVRGGLGKRVQIGADVRRAGGRVVVDAEVKHVFVSGSDGTVQHGECVTDPHTSGIWPATPFYWVGGAPYGDLPTGTCGLSDATNGQPKQIQVRTKVTTVLPGAAPPPRSTFGERKKPKIPSIWELLLPDP